MIHRSRQVGLLCAVALAVGLEHDRIVSAIPLERYGRQGAEYLEHLQRQHALTLTRGEGLWGRLLHLPDHLTLLDGQYPALLHLQAAAFNTLVGEGFRETLFINLLYLALLAAGTAWLASSFPEWIQPVPARTEQMASPLYETRTSGDRAVHAATLVLLVPAIYATSRRYYYDLPLAAFAILTAASLVHQTKRGGYFPLTGLFMACAALIKWQALLYLAPWWLLSLERALALSVPRLWKQKPLLARSAWAPPAALILAALFALLLLTPVLRISPYIRASWIGWGVPSPESGSPPSTTSLDVALQQGSDGFLPLEECGKRLGFYADGLLGSSLGLLLSLPLALGGLFLLKHPRLAWRATFVLLLPLFVLVSRVRVMDERFLLPLLPFAIVFATVGTSCVRASRGKWALGGLALLAGMLQLIAVDGLGIERLAPRPPTEARGWNRFTDQRPSPYRAYLEAGKQVCRHVTEDPSFILLEGSLVRPPAELHAWRYALAVACPQAEVGFRPWQEGGALDAPPSLVLKDAASDCGSLTELDRIPVLEGVPPAVRVCRP